VKSRVRPTAFNELATEAKQPPWKPESFKTVTI